MASLFYTSMLIRIFILICFSSILSEGLVKRCFKCRSRGELGSCKDPFIYTNTSAVEHIAGVETLPCATGWCGKVQEGGANSFKDEEYGMATERSCLVRVPSDSEERCAPTLRGNTKVMMCFCQGDLCNTAPTYYISTQIMVLPPVLSVIFR